jgi:hypothetical protein
MDCDENGDVDNGGGGAREKSFYRKIRLLVLECEDGMTWLRRSVSRDGCDGDEVEACGNVRRQGDSGVSRA